MATVERISWWSDAAVDRAENGAPPPVEPAEPTSEALAARVAQGDVAAFAQLYDRYARPVYALTAHMLGPTDAEEAMQAVFLRLWHNAGQFDPARGSFGAWFMAVARHLALDELRRRGQRRRLMAAGEVERLLGEAPDPAPDVEEQVWLREQGDVMLRALRQLPEEQRRVLVLAYFGDLSQSAIARQLGLPLGTVKKRIRLGLRKLHAALTREAYGARSDEAPASPSSATPSARTGRE